MSSSGHPRAGNEAGARVVRQSPAAMQGSAHKALELTWGSSGADALDDPYPFCFRIVGAHHSCSITVAPTSGAAPGMPNAAHTTIGQTGAGRLVALTREERMRHLLLLGVSGVGKSTLDLNIIAQDLARPGDDGVFVLDPNGDLAEAAIALVPRRRANQVCVLDFGDLDVPVGINFLEDTERDRRPRIIDGFISAARGIWEDSWGARLEQILRHSCSALLEHQNSSIALIPRLLSDDAFRARVTARVSNLNTQHFFGAQFASWRDAYRNEAIAPVVNKIDAMTFNPAIQNVIGQGRSTLHFEHAMAHGRIIICRVPKGLVGESNAYIIGALLLGRLLAAAQERAEMPTAQRRPFFVHVDEAQNFGGSFLATVVAELRKYNVGGAIATQMLAGLEPKVRSAVIGTVGTHITFRCGPEDSEVLAPLYDRAHQSFNPWQLQNLDIGSGMLHAPASDVAELAFDPAPAPRIDPAIIRKQSRIHYGRPRAWVENNIRRALGLPMKMPKAVKVRDKKQRASAKERAALARRLLEP